MKIEDEKIERIEHIFWGNVAHEIGRTICVDSEDMKAVREIIIEYTTK